MKREYLSLKSALSVSLIVLLLGVAVNHRISGKNFFGKTQVADGVPLPPPIQPPPKLDAGVLVADGVPLPPYPATQAAHRISRRWHTSPAADSAAPETQHHADG